MAAHAGTKLAQQLDHLCCQPQINNPSPSLKKKLGKSKPCWCQKIATRHSPTGVAVLQSKAESVSESDFTAF